VKSIRFILHRHPFDPAGGGSAQISRMMMEAAAAFGSVSATALSPQQWDSPWPVDCVLKPPLRPVPLVARSLQDHRSLIHTRFRLPVLRDQLRATTDDLYAVYHTYLVESLLDAKGPNVAERLFVNTDVSESNVIKSGRGLSLLRRYESARTLRDEVRCLSLAQAISLFDEDERDLYARYVADVPHLLRPCFDPEVRAPMGSGPNLLFLGYRSWRPNYLALDRLIRLWGALRKRSPQAQLLVVGQGPLPKNVEQDGIRILGHVPSLDPVWNEVRALVAPITIGGGVRVKILEAASRGVPVVATPAGVGSIASYLPVTPFASDEEIIEECITLLNDRTHAQQRSDELYEANRAWSSGGRFKEDVRKWLNL
jgi:glycosyltransferase involved in cell wall biosynthesis